MAELMMDEEPLKFEQVQKGDVIPTGAIEQWAQLSRDHPLFWAAQLKCKQHIEALLRAQGTPATLRSEGHMLRVLTDREATLYLHQKFTNSEHRMRRSHLQASEVDIGTLTAEERQSHALRLQVQALHLQALEAAERRAAKRR
jgi:hypothetical protein